MAADSHLSMLVPFAPSVPISVPLRVFSALRSVIWVTLLLDSPLTWWCRQGKRNSRADMEGPLYVPGAPDRTLEPGKAVLATVDELKEFKPFLLRLTIRSPHGDPLPHATVDFWQATTAGAYAYRTYALRGKFTTDEHGDVEVLTVAPGEYSAPAGGVRTGHFHMMLGDAEGRCDMLTTQLYVCHANDVRGMDKDFLNRLRKSRPQNMLHAWSIPANNDGVPFFRFPELPADDVESLKRVEWWNAQLAMHAPHAGLKIAAGGHTEIQLSEKPGWLSF